MSIRRMALAGSCALALLVPAAPAPAAEFQRLFAFEPGIPFSHPTGVAVDQLTGNVYVSDGSQIEGNETIDVFAANGGLPVGDGPSRISGLHFTEEPAGLAVDNTCYLQSMDSAECESLAPSDGDLYLANTKANSIERFALHSTAAREQFAVFSEPNGVAVDPQGNVYVADYYEGITEFTAAGKEIGRIEPALVPHPAYIAADGLGNVYVSDYGGGVAKLHLDSEGKLLSEERFDQAGAETGKAVAVGASGNVFVDRQTVVAEYDSSGKLLREFGPVSGSEGLAVSDEPEAVYVSNPGEGNVVVFGAQPSVVTAPASAVQANGATLQGSVNPQGSPVTACEFEYGTSLAYGLTVPCAPDQALQELGTTPVEVTAATTGLQPNETYHYRLLATTGEGTRHGRDRQFSTSTPPVIDQSPTVLTSTRTAATLTGGLVNPQRSPTTYYLEYGTTEGYGSKSAKLSAGSELADVTLATQMIGELQPATSYHYRLVAVNQGGTASGPDAIFSTAATTPPLAVTGAARDVAQTSAVLTGTVGAQGLLTSYGFEIATSPASLGAPTGGGTVGTASGETPVALELRGLQPGSTYYYRITATSSDGTTRGELQAFTTPGVPSPFTQLPTIPLIATPTVVFPTEARTATRVKVLTNAQKLANALKACKRKSKSRRAACERKARKKYGASLKRRASGKD